MRYIRRVLAALRQADEKYGLIDEGDKILVGLSGGKDSLCLLKALSIYDKFAGKHFKVQPVTLNLGFDNFHPEALIAYCKSIGYDLIVEDSSFVYGVLKAHQKEGKHIPCSICSRMKKAAMNSVAHRLGYNKVAFAHHRDDALETLFMNMIHGGRVATFEPKMYLEKSKIEFIRPLVLAKESDLANMAKEEELPVLASTCPANGFTERYFTKELLKTIYKAHPEAEENFAAMLGNYQGFQLYFDQIEIEDSLDKRYALRPLLSADDVLKYEEARAKSQKRLSPLKRDGTTYLVLYKHQAVGSINFNWDNPHQVNINSLEVLPKTKDGFLNVAKFFLAMTSADANPVLFLYKAKGKALAKRLGFSDQKEPGIPAGSWTLKIRR
ncbi:MAG: tRNA 2-thiocytidine biosynthesis protein TtcA [Tenericutes bacterium ADurb.BinA155]|nr:MAG: tRNA 2-thiocytidine biosynthesis protein TtcA [Tenericutes bacterium ADurb.BinA155]